jgi:hypothetical protein
LEYRHTNVESSIDVILRSIQVSDTRVGNTVDEPKLQQHFVTIWLLLKDHIKGVPGFDVISGNFMNIANLRVNIGGCQGFRGGIENILEALYIRYGNKDPTAID